MPVSSCAVHKHRSYVPLDVHHVWPLGMGGPDVESNKIHVCPTGHREIHEFMRRIETFKGAKPPWLVRRKYGVKVQFYAWYGYDQAKGVK